MCNQFRDAELLELVPYGVVGVGAVGVDKGSELDQIAYNCIQVALCGDKRK
jgi:hypothetical protein